jgi:hypothetical protein
MSEDWYLQPIKVYPGKGGIIQPPPLDADEMTRWQRDGLSRLDNGTLGIWRKRQVETRVAWWEMLEPEEWKYHDAPIYDEPPTS